MSVKRKGGLDVLRTFYSDCVELLDLRVDGKKTIGLKAVNSILGKSLGFFLVFIVINNVSLAGYGAFQNFCFLLGLLPLVGIGFNHSFISLKLMGKTNVEFAMARVLVIVEFLFQTSIGSILSVFLFEAIFEKPIVDHFLILIFFSIFLARVNAWLRVEMKASGNLVGCGYVDIFSSFCYFICIGLSSFFLLDGLLFGFCLCEAFKAIYVIYKWRIDLSIRAPDTSSVKFLFPRGQKIWWANAFDQFFSVVPIFLVVTSLTGNDKGLFSFAVLLAAPIVIGFSFIEGLIQRKLWRGCDVKKLYCYVRTSNLLIVCVSLCGFAGSIAIGLMSELFNPDLIGSLDYLPYLAALRICSGYRVLFSSLVVTYDGRNNKVSQPFFGFSKAAATTVTVLISTVFFKQLISITTEQYLSLICIVWCLGICLDIRRLYFANGLGSSLLPLAPVGIVMFTLSAGALLRF